MRARIPAAFWKIVAYIDKRSKKLECQAYLLYQDTNFLADKRGQHTLDITNYQVTITEIERHTGLEIPESLFTTNPLLFFGRDEVADGRTNEGPEAFEAPRSWMRDKDEDAAAGVVFRRSDLKDPKKKNLQMRERKLHTTEFVEHIHSSGVCLSHNVKRRKRQR